MSRFALCITSNPSEARGNLEEWRNALAKELDVVLKGFRRVTAEEFHNEDFERNPNVTYVPSTVVYTAPFQTPRLLLRAPDHIQGASSSYTIVQLRGALEGRLSRR